MAIITSHHIPPKPHTWQSDVENVHRLQEDEFLDREDFAGRAQFWAKLTTYWRCFNRPPQPQLRVENSLADPAPAQPQVGSSHRLVVPPLTSMLS